MRKTVSVLFVALLCAVSVFSLVGCTKYDYENKRAGFEISVDKTELSGETDQVTVTVKVTAKKFLRVTTGYAIDKNRAIQMQFRTKTDDSSYVLYDNEWDKILLPVASDFNMFMGQSLERTLKFSRLPSNNDGYEKTMPQGEYRLYVCFNSDEWFDTDIVIHAN